MLKGLSFQQLHDDKRPALELADVVDDADIGVVQTGGRARLLQEAFQGRVRAGLALGKELQRYSAPQPQILPGVYHSHAAAAQLLQDAIVRNRLARHGIVGPAWPSWRRAASA